MNPETTPTRVSDEAQGLLPWHKPEIQQIIVSLDTGFGGTSPADSDGRGLGSIFESDVRVKQDVAGITNALQGILALHGSQEVGQVYPQVVVTRKDGFKAVNYALLVPVLVEAIKQQQAMIEELRTQVKELH